MISFLAQDIISTQKMELLLVQVWRSQRGRSRTWWSQHWGSCRKTWTRRGKIQSDTYFHQLSILVYAQCLQVLNHTNISPGEVFEHYSLHHHPNPTVEHCVMVCMYVRRYTLAWSTKVTTGIRLTKVEVTGWDTKAEEATEVFCTKDDTPWLETSK